MARRHGELKDLMEDFVCVRLVKLWGVDLGRFQFDTNLTWAVLFMTPEGTTLGRYGALAADQSHKGTAQVNVNAVTLKGFAATLRRVKALAEAFATSDPQARQGLMGKQPRKPTWNRPEDLPAVAQSFTPGDTSLSGCLHCHNVGSKRVKSLWLAGKPVPESSLFPYPEPDLLGVSLSPDHVARVAKVEPGTPAAEAGLKVGDDIALFAGQIPVSPADIRWALQHAPEAKPLAVTVVRAGESVPLRMEVPAGYRRARSLMTASLDDLLPGFEVSRWIGSDDGLFEVEIPGWWGPADGRHVTRQHPLDVRGAGLKDGDTVLSVNGKKDFRHLADLVAWFWQNTRPGGTMTLAVRRGDDRHIVTVPLPRGP